MEQACPPVSQGFLIIVAVVSMEADGAKARRCGERLVESHGVRAGSNATAMHAGIQVEKDIDLNFGGIRGARELKRDAGVVEDRGEFRVRKRLDEFDQSVDVRADWLHRKQHIRNS